MREDSCVCQRDNFLEITETDILLDRARSYLIRRKTARPLAATTKICLLAAKNTLNMHGYINKSIRLIVSSVVVVDH